MSATYIGLAYERTLKPEPCPYCNAMPQVLVDESGLDDSHVECRNALCCKHPSVTFMRSQDEAIEKWNARQFD